MGELIEEIFRNGKLGWTPYPVYPSTNCAEYERQDDQVLHFLSCCARSVASPPNRVVDEPQPGRRLEAGTAPTSDLLFELLLVREQDTSDRDQDKWFECHGTQHLDVRTSSE